MGRLFVALSCLASLGACGDAAGPQATCVEGAEVVRESGLRWTDLACGRWGVASGGTTVTVRYTASHDGEALPEPGRPSGEPFTFLLGAGRVIEGWEEGVRGMQVGGVRRLLVPPELGFGSDDFAGIVPPDATLTFEIELLEVDEPPD